MGANLIDRAALARIESDDKHAEAVGLKLVETLRLHPVPGYTPKRYATSWGTKTAQGIARTVVRILQSEA